MHAYASPRRTAVQQLRERSCWRSCDPHEKGPFHLQPSWFAKDWRQNWLLFLGKHPPVSTRSPNFWQDIFTQQGPDRRFVTWGEGQLSRCRRWWRQRRNPWFFIGVFDHPKMDESENVWLVESPPSLIVYIYSGFKQNTLQFFWRTGSNPFELSTMHCRDTATINLNETMHFKRTQPGSKCIFIAILRWISMNFFHQNHLFRAARLPINALRVTDLAANPFFWYIACVPWLIMSWNAHSLQMHLIHLLQCI